MEGPMLSHDHAGSLSSRAQGHLRESRLSRSNDVVCKTEYSKTSPQRMKTLHQKVRTGCLRCKQRRIKCDETQPSCLRCLRINEICPGYQQPLTRIFGLSTLQGFNTEFEKICFDSFFSGGSSRLALFQPSNKSFWITVLPQLCQIHLSLRHGAIALGYINEPFYNPGLARAVQSKGSVNTLEVVMSHFNKALRSFADHVTHLSIEAKVSCCIVFTALTIYLYRIGAVSSHVSAALAFLRQHQRDKGHSDPVLKKLLAPIVRRLVIDACTFSGGMHGFQHGHDNPYEEYMYEVLRVPPSFRNYEDAYELVCNMLKYAIAVFFGYVEHYGKVSIYLQGTMRRFLIVLGQSSISSCAGAQLSEDNIAFYRKDLLLHHTMAQLIARFRPGMLEVDYWTFAPEFEGILEQVKELLKMEPQDPWRITLCWIPPVFFVATKCRVPRLRREAWSLMHQLSRVERGWTSCVAYTLAKFVIELEEEIPPTHSKIPCSEYIRLLSMQFEHNTQTALVKYVLQRDRTAIGMFSVRLPMKALLSKTLAGAPAINVPDPVLQAFGYTGTTMFSPRVSCHCHDSYESIRYTGKNVSGEKEEVIVWEAGLAIRKVVKYKDR